MHPSLTKTKQAVFWVDQLTRASEERPSLVQDETADLVVIGGGFTGLWTALIASETNPGRKIVLLESDVVGYGASGRNGGFCDASITHGIENGMSHWPNEMSTLLRLGKENLEGISNAISKYEIECDLEATGEINVALEQWQVDQLLESTEIAKGLGENVEFLDAEAVKKILKEFQMQSVSTKLNATWKRLVK